MREIRPEYVHRCQTYLTVSHSQLCYFCYFLISRLDGENNGLLAGIPLLPPARSRALNSLPLPFWMPTMQATLCSAEFTHLTMCLPWVLSHLKLDCQSKIRETTGKVLFDKYIFTFKISMSNAGLKKSSRYLTMKVGKTTGHAPCHAA